MKASRLIHTGTLVVLCAIGSANTPAQQPAAGTPRPPAVVVPAGKPTVFLWPNGAPGSEARKDEQKPSRARRSSTSIILRYRVPATQGDQHRRRHDRRSRRRAHEPVDHARGFNPAQALADKGIAAFVLKNRLQSSGTSSTSKGSPTCSAPSRSVRSRAAEWGVDPNRIGAARILCRRRAGRAGRDSERSRASQTRPIRSSASARVRTSRC